jgi:hypothetical protein
MNGFRPGRGQSDVREDRVVKPTKIVFAANTAWYLYNFRRNTIRAFLEAGNQVYTIAPHDAFVPKLEGLGCIHAALPMEGTGTPSGNAPRCSGWRFCTSGSGPPWHSTSP